MPSDTTDKHYIYPLPLHTIQTKTFMINFLLWQPIPTTQKYLLINYKNTIYLINIMANSNTQKHQLLPPPINKLNQNVNFVTTKIPTLGIPLITVPSRTQHSSRIH
jgi:hypothetical protein